MFIKDWKERLLTFGIAIILVLFIGYSINTFLEGDKHSEEYAKNLFIIACISGIISVIAGYFIEVESVGIGLFAGGLMSLLYGVVRYWPYAENKVRVILLGVVLGVFIWLGFKKFGAKSKKK